MFVGENISGLLAVLFAIACLRHQPASALTHFGREQKVFAPSPSEYCHAADGRRINCSSLPCDEWFDQLLDHFNTTNERTWKQRFYVNKEYHKEGGPVFLMIGGEGEATAQGMVQGAWVHYAREHKALMFQLEHRFYGKSHPTSDLSTANLVYLSSVQALADLANFIVHMHIRHPLPHATRWIAFGGSYSGSLAAWLRMKYPHLVHAAVSSSAPLLAKADFSEYYDVVRESLADYKFGCVTSVANSINHIEKMLLNTRGRRHLTKMFRLCDPLETSDNKSLDDQSLLTNLAYRMSNIVQNHFPRISGMCDMMLNKSLGNSVERLATFIQENENHTCLNYRYKPIIVSMQNTSWSVDKIDRRWTYQTCTEFGFYQTSGNAMFHNRFPVSFFYKHCVDVYGQSFDRVHQDRNIFRTNARYGGLHLRTTNVIYVHGSLDPWSALGLTSSSIAEMPTVFIKGTSHGTDMDEPQPYDPPSLTEARATIRQFISSVLTRVNE